MLYQKNYAFLTENKFQTTESDINKESPAFAKQIGMLYIEVPIFHWAN